MPESERLVTSDLSHTQFVGHQDRRLVTRDRRVHNTGLDPKKSGIVAIIPAYNEERFIGSVVLATYRFAESVFVIDDGSTDDTTSVARAAGAKVIRMEHNGGKAAAILLGLRTVMENKGIRAVVLLDGDGQHLPNELPRVIEPILQESADLVVGSRFLQTRSEIPWWRQIGQHALTWLTNATSGVLLTDSQSGFRALSPRTVHLLTLRSEGFAVESEMQFIAREHGLRVIEVPIHCIYAEPPKRNPVTHGLQVIDAILKLTGQMRPLLFFGLPSLFLLTGGVWVGILTGLIYQRTHELAVGYALIAVLFVVIGTVGLSTGVMLHSIRALLLDLLRPEKPLATAQRLWQTPQDRGQSVGKGTG